MHVGLFFDNYVNFLGVNANIKENGFNLIN